MNVDNIINISKKDNTEKRNIRAKLKRMAIRKRMEVFLKFINEVNGVKKEHSDFLVPDFEKEFRCLRTAMGMEYKDNLITVRATQIYHE